EADGVEVAEVGVDPGDRRERALGGVLEEAGRLGVYPDLKRGFPVQVFRAEKREVVVVSEGVTGVGETQGSDLEGIPAPGNAVGIEVPYERRLVVHRRAVVRQVIAAVRGAAGNRVEAVGPGRAGNRAEPAIADSEMPGD